MGVYLKTTINGPNDEELEAEYINISEKGLDNDCVYMYCGCPKGMEYLWKVPYIGPGYYRGTCPNCGFKFGGMAKNREENKGVYSWIV